ncbi:hypothetical protein HPB51_013098 [Rhipicephalus microplus]|uniref:Bridge-like lipid transfer protein family member 1 C-terminal domain-containing protein n=1 Tax=Rhipicephalus microplus TaxID=6941 RepID=A0A9J6F4B1_RHIMP|nr:hypothetical protein HPB51_013098 [Rhipicephalus microplus]
MKTHQRNSSLNTGKKNQCQMLQLQQKGYHRLWGLEMANERHTLGAKGHSGHGLCLRFADEFEVSIEDWKPCDATTTNLCVVSEGTYEICSRTIAAQASSNAKWILNVQWQMEGVDIHVDVGISKALSALFRTLTALTGEGDEGESPEEQACAAQEPVTLRHACLLLDPSVDAKKRSRLIEKEMNEQAKIISDLRFLGASQSTIEQEERRLKELATAVFNDFRRDVIKKLRRQSVKVGTLSLILQAQHLQCS